MFLDQHVWLNWVIVDLQATLQMSMESSVQTIKQPEVR